MLEMIHSPEDIREMTYDELNRLCAEIREELIRTVSRNGGHLASNLGVVELTLAIHRVYNTPDDQLIFDVGHQSYVHKLITGRYERFGTLRKYGGLSGFPKRAESIYDVFETGHSSTAISAALGLARARDLKNESRKVVAVVGDGAFTGGMCYEALNDAGNSNTQLTVILNDNEMSIAANVGALSKYLTNLRVSNGWRSTKEKVRSIAKVPVIGHPLYHLAHSTKNLAKSLLLGKGENGFFEALGFHYFGPIDGHDLPSLEKTLRMVREYEGPSVLHVITKKGCGYMQAEYRPETFHGTPPFYIETGARITLPENPSNGHVAADMLASLADINKNIVAITAAMELGTGLDHFANVHPDRIYDVGIAEEHAVTMAAGLAAGGMRPYFAVYASFFQRCYDQMIHDVGLQALPVVFLIDRAGIGGEDGETHHGLFDFASLLPVPGMTVLAPCCKNELEQMVAASYEFNGPCAIRYPKRLDPVYEYEKTEFSKGRWNILVKGEDCILLAVGSMVSEAIKAAKILSGQGIGAEVVNCSTVTPLDIGFMADLKQRRIPYFTVEEHMMQGGFGSLVSMYCLENGIRLPEKCFAVASLILSHGEHKKLLQEAGLTYEQIASGILDICRKDRKNDG